MASTNSLPPGAYVRIIPANSAAKAAFHAVLERIQENDKVMPNARRFIVRHDELEEISQFTNTNSEAESNQGDDDSTPTPLRYGGFFLIDLGCWPQKPGRGWACGNDRSALQGKPGEEVEFVLTLNGSEHRVHRQHCRLHFNWDSHALVITAEKNRRVRLFSSGVYELNGTSMAIQNAKSSFEVGALRYNIEFTGTINSESLHKRLTDIKLEHNIESSVPPLSVDPTPAPSDIHIPGYTLKDPEACGTFGTVFAGIEDGTGTCVAVKRVAVTKDTRTSVNAEHDILKELLKKNESKYICRFIKAVETGSPSSALSETYFVFKTFADETLRKVIDSNNATTTERLCLFVEMLKGLAYMHNIGLMHRDIKPGNIAIVSRSPPHAMFIDFGHSTFDRTSLDHCKGTVIYLAPEVMGLKRHTWTRPYDNRADVFSLGLCAYQLILGRKVDWKTHHDSWTRLRDVLDSKSIGDIGPFLQIVRKMLEIHGPDRIAARFALREAAEELTNYKVWNNITAAEPTPDVVEKGKKREIVETKSNGHEEGNKRKMF